MRSLSRLGSALGVLIVAGCVTTGGGSTSTSRYEAVSTPRPGTRAWQSYRDSIEAQAIADREGPGVSLRVEFYNVSGSRRATVNFHVDDDAYVLVGHIDADGIVRIAFPTNPGDDGFVKGDRSYRTPEFFAGFLAEFRTRYNMTYPFRSAAANYDSYDGGLGYAFIIASWRPMHFEKFSANGEWYTYELADASYLSDPRPAIHELASLLAGDNREAYTVKFARYTSSQQVYTGGYSSLASSSYGYCSASTPFGYSSSPFYDYGIRSVSGAGWGESFYYRGSRYYYDAAGDCYRQGSYGGYDWRYAYGYPRGPQTGSGNPGTPTPTRTFDIEKGRTHPEPKELPGYRLPMNVGSSGGNGTGDASPPVVRVSPTYRERGLITTEEPSRGGPIRRQPSGDGRTPVGVGDDRGRPSIQQMVNRRDQATHETNSDGGWARTQNRGRAVSEPASSTPVGSDRYTPRNPSSGDNQSSRQRPSVDNSPRNPETRGSSPTSSAPRSAPVDRSSAPATPRSAPVERSSAPSTPPPAPPHVSSPPPSSSGSSGSSSGGSSSSGSSSGSSTGTGTGSRPPGK